MVVFTLLLNRVHIFLQFLCLIWSEKHGNERVNPESSQSMFLDRCDWENIFGLYVTKTESKIKCKHDSKVLSYRCIEIVLRNFVQFILMLVEFFILIVWVSQAKVWFSTTSETQNKLNNTHYVTVLSTCVCWVYVSDALPLSIEFLCVMYNIFSSTNISPEDIFQEIAFLWFNIFWQLVISCGSKSLKDPTKATKRVSKVMKKNLGLIGWLCSIH